MNNKVNIVMDYINKNLKNDNRKSTYLNNYRKLIAYFTNNKFEFDISELNYIYNSCNIISITFNKVYDDINELEISNIKILSLLLSIYNDKKLKDDDIDFYGAYYNGINSQNSDFDAFRFYIVSIGKIKNISLEDEKKLFIESHNGNDKAKNELINCNLKLVVSIAKHYVGRGLPLDDLIQEGNIGLINAVDKFNPNMECKFSTYAYFWIRQSISKSIIDKSKEIRIPYHSFEKLNLINKCIANYYISHDGKIASYEIISEETGICIKTIKKLKMIEETTSLSNSTGEDSDEELVDYISDDSFLSPEEYTIRTIQNEKLEEMLFELTEKERYVINERFGFNGGEPKTLEEIGEVLHCTKEWVRKIEEKALNKLKNPSRIKKLRD